MDRTFLWVALAACALVVVILMLGVGNFARGGENAGRRSNRLMTMRVIAQAAAVALLLLAVALGRGGA